MTRGSYMTADRARASSARLRRRWSALLAMACSRVLAGVALLLLAAGLSMPSPTFAQPTTADVQTQPGPPTPAKPEANQPMLLQADELVYDNQNNRVTARGNVEIYYGSYTLLADRVVYDRASNTLIAEGNVTIKEPKGAVINADQITLTDDFRDGFLASLKIVAQDQSRIAAARAIREHEDVTTFEQAAFTPCKPCVENPAKPPTWQIRATKVVHRKTEATITYHNAWFELFGYPVAWFPYFQHADPSVKRKSGFLMASYTSSDRLGTTVEVPYYFALAQNYDFTFRPTYTEKRGILWRGEWRHRTAHGRYEFEFAGIQETTSGDVFNSLNEEDGELRGTIRTVGEFALNQYWQWGWNVTAETDDTFRRFYGIDSILTTDRVSELHLIGQRGRNFFAAYAYNFGGLLATDTSLSESWVHPVIDYNYVFADPVLGGELSFDTNVLSLSRNDGADTSRFITQVKWRRTLIDGMGQVFTPFMQARGDLYHVSNVDIPDPDEPSFIARGVGLVGMEYRYPFVQHLSRSSLVFEPIAQVIVRPDVTYQSENPGTHKCGQGDVPNEDACSLVYDDTLLFDIDKFSGYDRIESGTRANVGFRYTWQHDNGGFVRAVFGQSYHIFGSNEFQTDSGLDTARSDYVAGLYVQPFSSFGFIGQGRFDEQTLDLRRTDLVARSSYGPFSTALVYANIVAQPGLGIPRDRQEIQSSGTVKITDRWSVFANLRYDIERDQRITDSVGIQWSDDCFMVSLTYAESFIRDRDIEPSETVYLRFSLKNLGAYSIDVTPLGQLGALGGGLGG